jgi:hypothetical protein
MTTQITSPRPTRHTATHGVWLPKPSHHTVERASLTLLMLVLGVVIFQAVYRSTDEMMLALLAPVVAFLAVGSLFAGHGGRH